MKKIISVALFLILTLAACTTAKSQEPESANKFDPDQPYIYVEKTYESQHPKELPLKNNPISSHYFPEMSKDKSDGDIEVIILNIDSEDAKTLQEKFHKIQKEMIENKSTSEYIQSFLLLDYTENQNIISFMVFKSIYLPDSDSQDLVLNAYVFDKATGKLMKNDEVLELTQETPESILASMKSQLPVYEEPWLKDRIDYQARQVACSNDQNLFELCLYPKSNRNFFVTKDNKLHVILENKYINQAVLNPEALGYDIFHVE